MGVRVPRSLLRDEKKNIRTKRHASQDNDTTNLYETLEVGILFQLILHALLRNREMADISRICQPELRSGFEEYIANTVDNRCLLALPYKDNLEQVTVTFAKIEHVPEDLVHEFVDFAWSDDRWVGAAQRADKQLLAKLSIIVHR